MRVGVVDNPPWVRLGDGEPSGVEPELVRRFAASLGAEVEWMEGPETELVEAMRGYQLDLLIGGLTTNSLWQREVAITRPIPRHRDPVRRPPRHRIARRPRR